MVNALESEQVERMVEGQVTARGAEASRCGRGMRLEPTASSRMLTPTPARHRSASAAAIVRAMSPSS